MFNVLLGHTPTLLDLTQLHPTKKEEPHEGSANR